jgi:hypothetical protein
MLSDKFIEEMNHYRLKPKQFLWYDMIISVDSLHVSAILGCPISLVPYWEVPVKRRSYTSEGLLFCMIRKTPMLCIELRVFVIRISQIRKRNFLAWSVIRNYSFLEFTYIGLNETTNSNP